MKPSMRDRRLQRAALAGGFGGLWHS